MGILTQCSISDHLKPSGRPRRRFKPSLSSSSLLSAVHDMSGHGLVVGAVRIRLEGMVHCALKVFITSSMPIWLQTISDAFQLVNVKILPTGPVFEGRRP